MSGIISIVGNLGADPERKRIGDSDVCNLRVACKLGYGDRAVTSWWDVSVWGKPAEWAAEGRKGAAVTVQGEIQAREHDGRVYLGIRASSVRYHERQAEQGNRQPERGNGGNGGGWGGNSGGGGQW